MLLAGRQSLGAVLRLKYARVSTSRSGTLGTWEIDTLAAAALCTVGNHAWREAHQLEHIAPERGHVLDLVVVDRTADGSRLRVQRLD